MIPVRMPRRVWVASTPTRVTPAVASCSPPGTVVSKKKYEPWPTQRPSSHAEMLWLASHDGIRAGHCSSVTGAVCSASDIASDAARHSSGPLTRSSYAMARDATHAAGEGRRTSRMCPV